MYLVRLVYTSKVSSHFAPTDIETILETARRKNDEHSVTGVLCFSSNYFLQCLEGSRARVNQTYRDILQDNRHEDVVMLAYEEIPHRDFDDWHMGYIPSSSVSRGINMRYSGSGDFTPYEMSGNSAYQMLKDMGRTVPLV